MPFRLRHIEQLHARGETHHGNLGLARGRVEMVGDMAEQAAEIGVVVGDAAIVLIDHLLHRVIAGRWRVFHRVGGVGGHEGQGERETKKISIA
jgi:hypothetical protein